MDELFLTEERFDEIMSLLRRKKNVILQGAPGTGKTFIAKRLAYLLLGHEDDVRVQMTQFHQSTSYEDFIEGFRPQPKRVRDLCWLRAYSRIDCLTERCRSRKESSSSSLTKLTVATCRRFLAN